MLKVLAVGAILTLMHCSQFKIVNEMLKTYGELLQCRLLWHRPSFVRVRVGVVAGDDVVVNDM